jgi:hypothetical protein
MPSDLTPEMKRTTCNPANLAPETPESKSILFLEMPKKSILKAIPAGNAGLAGCFILNVRNLFLIPLFSTELGFTTPLFRHFRHTRFFNPAREMRGSISILLLQALKMSLLAVKTAGNAGLAGCFILNVRKGISLISSSQQLGCTPPPIPQIPHTRFFNLNLQIHKL